MIGEQIRKSCPLDWRAWAFPEDELSARIRRLGYDNQLDAQISRPEHFWRTEVERAGGNRAQSRLEMAQDYSAHTGVSNYLLN
jgi:hypothetical protein